MTRVRLSYIRRNRGRLSFHGELKNSMHNCPGSDCEISVWGEKRLRSRNVNLSHQSGELAGSTGSRGWVRHWCETRVSHLVLNSSDSPKQHARDTPLTDNVCHFGAKFKKASTQNCPRKKMLYNMKVNISDITFLKMNQKRWSQILNRTVY